jgi:lathosterol oxidase
MGIFPLCETYCPHYLMPLLEFLKELSWQVALPLFLVENLVVLLLAVGFGYLLQKLFGQARALGPLYQPVTRQETGLVTCTLLINTGITYAGFWLWQQGFIQIRTDVSYRVLLDFLVLFLGMDLLMYVFHYLIHHTILYRWVHSLHPTTPAPNPSTCLYSTPSKR